MQRYNSSEHKHNLKSTRDAHAEWNKSERERQILYIITHIWNLIYSTSEPFQRKENHGLGEETCGCLGGEGGSGRDWELGVSDANYCSWNGFTMRSAVQHWELCLDTYFTAWQWEEKVCIHACVTGSPCCTVGKQNKTKQKSTVLQSWHQRHHSLNISNSPKLRCLLVKCKKGSTSWYLKGKIQCVTWKFQIIS